MHKRHVAQPGEHHADKAGCKGPSGVRRGHPKAAVTEDALQAGFPPTRTEKIRFLVRNGRNPAGLQQGNWQRLPGTQTLASGSPRGRGEQKIKPT